MGERKVLNKYIPADFDPKLVPRGKKPKVCIAISMFSISIYNLLTHHMHKIYKKYLGIQRFRFYIKCSDCARPITFCKYILIYAYVVHV